MNETAYKYAVDKYIASENCELVDDEVGGRVFDMYSFVFLPGLRRILAVGGGWVFGESEADSTIGKVPDTFRFAESARIADVPVSLTEEVSVCGNIPPEHYGRLVLTEHAHPVGVGGMLGFYRHDVGVDHFPALVVAGKSLLELLIPAKVVGPEGGDLVDVARAYDRSTMTIRSALDDHLNPRYAHVDILFGGYADVVRDFLHLTDRQAKVRIAAIEKLLKAGLERLELV